MKKMNVTWCLASALMLLAPLSCSHFEARPPQNSAPEFVTTPPLTRADGSALKPGLLYQYQPVAKDANAGDKITFRSVNLPVNATFDGTLLRWTPSMEQAGLAQYFRLEASDGHDGMRLQEWTITPEARSAPANLVLTPLGTGNPIELQAYRWKLDFTDDDSGSATVQALSPDGATYEAGSQSVLWTPPAGGPGSVDLRVRVVNNVGLSTEVVLPLTISKANSGTSPNVEIQPGTEGSPAALARAANLREVDAFHRITSRNLFHPTRGILPAGSIAASAMIVVPNLVGTVVSERHSQASLRWPGEEALVVLAVNKSHQGVTLLKVQPDRIQVQVGSGERQWLELAKMGETEKPGSDEFTRLLTIGGSNARNAASDAKPFRSVR